jgi:hypothetical protein
MTNRSKAYSFLLAAGMTVATVACGGGSASMTGPEAAATAVSPQVGATIAGAVQSGAAAAGEIGASSVSGLRVSVTGTSLQATTDGSGRFTLSGVPSGRIELRFQGSGIDARLELEGLQNGQTLTLTIRVSGSSATRVDDDDDDDGEVEFKGKVDSVGASSLVVAGRTVKLDASTRLLDHDGMMIPLSGFHQGDFVEVEGTPESDGTVLAKKVKLEETDEDEEEDEEEDDEEGQEVEFTGTISRLNPLVIAGRTVKTDGSTRYFGRKRETLPSSEVLKINNKVEVEGHKQPDNSVLAKKIELED